MIVIDDQGAIQDFSHAAERLFGWSAADVAGRNVSMQMPSTLAKTVEVTCIAGGRFRRPVAVRA